MSLQSIVGASGLYRLQDPPTSINWRAVVIPDTIGDGTGTKMQNVTGTAITRYYIDFSNNNQLLASQLAPSNAKWVIGYMNVTDTAGIGNDTNVLMAPQNAQDPPVLEVYSHIASAGGITQGIIIPIDSDYTLVFQSTGPAGSFLSKTVIFVVFGYAP